MTEPNPVTDGLPIGEVQQSRRRTLTEGDFALLTSATWTTGALHTDAEYAKSTRFGKPILGGPVVAAVVSGLWYTSCCEEFYARCDIEAVAALGMSAKFRAPVTPGDTIRVETTLTSARPSESHPGKGVYVVEDRTFNQRDELVIEMSRALLYQRT